MTDNEQKKRIVEQISNRLGTSKNDIESALNSGNYSKLFSNLDEEKRKKIEGILSDKEQTKKLMDSPQAQAIIKKLMG